MDFRKHLILPACLGLAAQASWAIQLGDSRDAVLAEFGAPETQYLRDDAVETLVYPVGEIRLSDGLVCFVRLTDGSVEQSSLKEREMAMQLRIAELEARLAAAHARLAIAEVEARNAGKRANRQSWTSAAVAPTYSSPPASWQRPTPFADTPPVSETLHPSTVSSRNGL